MNKIYKVVWSEVRHAYVVASELAKGKTKSSTGARRGKTSALAAAVCTAVLGMGALMPMAEAAAGTAFGDTASAGKDAIALGYHADASGEYSTSIGYMSIASGKDAMAIGRGTEARGQDAVALGALSQAYGERSLAGAGGVTGVVHYYAKDDKTIELTKQNGKYYESDGTEYTGEVTAESEKGKYAIALGYGTKATGEAAVALGQNSVATGINAVAIGQTSKAYSQRSLAVQGGTTGLKYRSSNGKELIKKADGKYYELTKGTPSDEAYTGAVTVSQYENLGAVAIGDDANASNNYATAIGRATTATAEYSTAIGYFAAATGQYAVALGRSTVASGEAATAMGDNSVASGAGAFAAGVSSQATADYAIAMGDRAQATGRWTIAIGKQTVAGGEAAKEHATAVGAFSQATGSGSFAGGGGQAAGGWSVALGSGAEATANYATALGDGAKAYGGSSVALGKGSQTTSDAFRGLAIGYGSKATAYYSMALGDGAQATARDAVAIGKDSQATTTDAVAIGTNSIAAEENTISFGRAEIKNEGGTVTQTAITRRLVNVAAGTADTDAVNVSQLNEASDEVVAIIGTEAGGEGDTAYTALSTEALQAKYAGNDYLKEATSLTDADLKLAAQIKSLSENVKAGSGVQLADEDGKQVKQGQGEAITVKGDGNLHTAVKNDAIVLSLDEDITIDNSVTVGTEKEGLQLSKDTISFTHEGDDPAKLQMAADGSVAMGKNVKAGKQSIAIGDGAQATGTSSISIGLGNVVTGNNSGAFGDPNKIDGNNSYSVGNNNTVNTDNTFVLGNNVNTTAKNSVILGEAGSVSVEGGVALGANSSSSRAAGVAGYDLSTGSASTKTDAAWKSTAGAVAVGDDSKGVTRQITGVAAGSEDTDAVNVAQLKQANAKVADGLGEMINQNTNAINRLESNVKKVGAGAAALAAMHPMEYDPEDKLSFAVGLGNYRGENAAALGMYYRPTENIMLSLGGTVGNDDNMVNMGVSFALDKNHSRMGSKAQMASQINNLKDENSGLKAEVEDVKAQNAALEARLAKIEQLLAEK